MKRNLGTFLIVISVILLFCWLGWKWWNYAHIRRREQQQIILFEIGSDAKNKKEIHNLPPQNREKKNTRRSISQYKTHAQWLSDTLRENGEFRKYKSYHRK